MAGSRSGSVPCLQSVFPIPVSDAVQVNTVPSSTGKRVWSVLRLNQSRWDRVKGNTARAQTTLALSRDRNWYPSSSETSSDGDIVTALRHMDFSLFIFILALMASVLVHFNFSALNV